MLAFLLLLVLSAADAKNCSKGKPCGNSCIARDKTCHTSSGSSSRPTPTPSPVPAPKPDPAPAVAAPAHVVLPYVVWYQQADGRLLLARSGTSPSQFVACYPLKTSCDVPPPGMTVSSTLHLESLPSTQHAALMYTASGFARACSVYSCERAS